MAFILRGKAADFLSEGGENRPFCLVERKVGLHPPG